MTEPVLSSMTKCTPEAARPGTPVIVDVFARPKAGGGVEWSHEWRWGENGPSQGTGTIVIPKRKSTEPGTPMHFHLRDETDPKRGFAFHDHKGAPMWVRKNSCPPEDRRCDYWQIPPNEMDMTPKLLKAFNLNSEKCTLHYRLWFKDKDGQKDSYDPDITNGGKG